MPTAVELVTGLAGAVGSDFRASQNQLLFVEFGGKLSALNLFPASAIVSQNSVTLKGTFTFDLDTGVEGGTGANFDIWWEQKTSVIRDMSAFSTAKIINLGVVDFNTITAASLLNLAYSTTPIPGNNDPSNKLVNGDVFAVKTTSGNYAKVKVVTYGYDMQIQYVTYHVDSPYVVLGTGYTNPEDVKASKDNVHAYVTERSGDLVRVSLASANRASATVVTSGMTAPQQFALDESHNVAYIVEYAAAGHLYRVDLTTGAKTAVVSNLNFPVGITLSPDLQYAYVSEQTTGPDGGRVSRYQLSNGARTPMVKGLTAPFFLGWADAAKTSLLVPERDPANRITSINTSNFASQVVAPGVPFRPSSVALSSPGTMLICSDTIIEMFTFLPFQPAGPLLMGIGFVPFDKVFGGLADTTGDPAYFYQVKNTPFGGTLPLMVNHQRAANDGASYYRIKVDGVIRSDSWTDEKWNGTQYVATTTAPTLVAGQPGYYPVHPVSELFLWLNPTLGSLMDSTNLTNATHTIILEFINGLGILLETSTPLTIRVDNNQCAATVTTPTLNGISADPNCGLLHYTGLTAFPVVMPLVATHPNGFATYSFQLLKGVNTLTPPSVSNQPVPAPANITASVNTLLGTCASPVGPGIAAFAEYLYVAATIINGWSRQSQYDAQAALAFVLVP